MAMTTKSILHPEVGDIPLLRDALLANGIAHTFDELPGDHFNKNAGRGT
jgi:hypothetical protein